MRKVPLDPKVFWPSFIVTMALVFAMIINPEAGSRVVNAAFAIVTGKFGWLFLIFCVFCFSFLLWLAFGRYGSVKFGRPDEKPEFSYFSYIAMLFCAGIGGGIMYWSFVEPIYYFDGPPLGLEPGSVLAAEWAVMYPQFHWGFSAWAIYAILTFPIAYSMWIRRDPYIRMSTSSKGALGKLADGWLGTLFDVLVVFGIIGAVGTSLGLGVPLISSLFSYLFGVQESMLLNIFIIALWTLLFGFSVYKGLTKGIKVLSDINIYLAIIFAVFILLAGPTVYILSMWTNSFGVLLDNFFRISFWMDPVAKGGFPEAWTVFYWAWWIAYAPMMGLFVARISKGRTIKEVVIAELIFGTLGCWVYFGIMGSFGIYVQWNELAPVSELLAGGFGPAIIGILNTLPLGTLLIIVFTIMEFIFLATTLDSSAYILASVCSKDIAAGEDPARWHRLLWALILALTSVGLLMVGGLQTVQTASIVVALPLIPVMIIMAFSAYRWLNEDFGPTLAPKIIAIDYQPGQQQVVVEATAVADTNKTVGAPTDTEGVKM
ncbi:MAG: BCCT family transporter [Desulfitobacteriaceae bacterium]|nr:BCCT family transporter [Desulfitobacteriaceae bacterium]MDD4752394.1 BCCT family transporter [Desulfitobacteriaceae bacterium]